MNTGDRLSRAQRSLAHQVPLTALLDQIATMFERTSSNEHNEIVAQFHNVAGPLPYADDSDYGALLLEFTADSLNDVSLAKRLYQEAFYRASWCVHAATAGGESLARSRDCQRIGAKLHHSDDTPNVA